MWSVDLAKICAVAALAGPRGLDFELQRVFSVDEDSSFKFAVAGRAARPVFRVDKDVSVAQLELVVRQL